MSNTYGFQLRIDDIEGVGLSSTRQRNYLSDIRFDRVNQLSASLFWENEIVFSDRFRSVLGLRHDYYDFDVEAIAAGDSTSLAANTGTADSGITTASLSLIYKLSDNHELYASIGEGFHSNDARGVTIALDPLTAEPVERADPLVDTLASEIGLRTFFSERLNATVALWQLDIDSELIFVGDAGNTEDTGVGSERYGIELTGYLSLQDRWSTDLEIAWTDARFKAPVDGSTEIPGALDTVVSAGLNYRANDNVNVNLRFRYFDDFPLAAETQADGSTMLNLRIGWQVSDSLAFNLDVLNLADSDDRDIEYFYESQLPGETMPVPDRHFHVFEPRSMRLYADYKF